MYAYAFHSLRGSAEAAALLYFCQGHQIAAALLAALDWRFGDSDLPPSVLDFAAGFGRATRFLAARLPAGAVAAAEIAPDAAAFHRDVLGVDGLVSTREPADFDAGRRFSAILAASLFSHLPRAAFDAWLARLYGLLEPGGFLLISTHGPELLGDPAADWSRGLVFRPESETRRLSRDEYGTAYVTEGFVRESARRAGAEPHESVLAFPRGLCAHQDVYLVVQGEPGFFELRLPRFPRGAVDEFAIGARDVTVAGWAATDGEEAVPEVRLYVGSEVAGVRSADGDRRFRFTFPRAIPADAVVRVEARTAQGLANIVAMGTLRPHLEGRV